MSPRCMHLSTEEYPSLEDRGPRYDVPGFEPIYRLKPYAFWYSIDDRYLQSLSEQDALTRYEFEVHLGETSMVHLTSGSEVLEFTARFGSRADIDWEAVVAEYSGVELNPYVCAIAKQIQWYHMWEYACGAIWRVHNLVLTPRGRVDRARYRGVRNGG